MNKQEQQIEIKMKEFHTEAEKVLGKDSIIAFDFFYVHDYYHQYLGKSYSLSVNNYIKEQLLPFIEEHGSLGNSPKSAMEYINYLSELREITTQDLTFTIHPDITKRDEKCTLEEMSHYLAQKKFGNSCFWMNNRTQHENGYLNTSLFLVFQKNISKEEFNQIKCLILDHFMSVITTVIVEEWIEIIKQKEADEITQHLIKDHQHTIKNFGFKSNLNKLYDKMKEGQYQYDSALLLLDKIRQMDLLRDVISDTLYNYNNKEVPLLEKEKLDTYTSILNLIHQAKSSGNDNKTLEFDASIISHPQNSIAKEDINDVVTLLLNLYSNSKNHSEDEFWVKLFLENELFHIEFINKGQMPPKLIEMLNNPNAHFEKNYKGIYFIKKALDNLKHINRVCKYENELTHIKLVVNKK